MVPFLSITFSETVTYLAVSETGAVSLPPLLYIIELHRNPYWDYPDFALRFSLAECWPRSQRLQSCDAFANGVFGQLGDAMQIQFVHDLFAVGFDRLYADE
jgi:hypothetical protein